jgi:Fe-S-cluster containining protein
MQDQFDFFAYGKKVREVATSFMSTGRNAVEISGRMHLLAVAAEKDLVRFGHSGETSRVACGPGCGACCVLNVAVLMPEAVTITWFMQRHFSAEQLDGLRSRLQELLRLTRWLDDEERLFLRKPCAFLDELGSCIIHTVRPLLCRAITSTDPRRCHDAIATVPLAGAPSVEMDLFQKKLIETVYCELAGSLEELGLDHRPRRLSAAILMLFSEPELITLYANGENVPTH